VKNVVLYDSPLGIPKNCGFREPTKGSKPNTFPVIFLLDALRKLIKRRRSDRITGIIKEEPQPIPGDNPFEAARFCSISAVRRSLEYDTLSLFWLIDMAYVTQRRWNFFQVTLVLKNPQACRLSNPEVATEYLA
jgi:hypothetical protein